MPIFPVVCAIRTRFGRIGIVSGFLAILLLNSGVLVRQVEAAEPPLRYVIHISADGLRPDVVQQFGADELPNLHRLRNEGAYTDNARTDYDYSITLPNHLSQLTGRRVTGPAGHNWTGNTDPGPYETLHTNKGGYVAGVFDVAHDNGIRTGAYVSKSKFSLLEQSWGSHGRPDTIGIDNGRDKIDRFVYEKSTSDLVDRFIQDMKTDPNGYSFLHLADPDSRGHRYGWSLSRNSRYMDAVRHVDHLLGRILDFVAHDEELAGRTAVILTADHGGSGRSHGASSRREHYTIPFYVWGAGRHGDLYRLQETSRSNPKASRPAYDAIRQPVRNADAANLALGLLGLGPVPGSTINPRSDLILQPAPELAATE